MKFHILITLPTLITTSLVHANWIADPDTLCKIHNPNPQPNETATWSGDCKDGKADGNGTLQFFKNNQKTDTYVGTMAQGKASGQGVANFSNGDKYDGDWQDGKMHGKGIYTTAKGSIYKGDWQQGSMHGKGSYQFFNGNYYDGDWQNDNQHGYGIYRHKDGLVYEGEWKDNKINGLGKYTAPKGHPFIPKNPQNQKGYWQGDDYVLMGIFYENKYGQTLPPKILTKSEYQYVLQKLGKAGGQIKKK